MVICRLLKVILATAVIFTISFAPGVAEMFIGRASASISATATVVQSIGISSPDDTLLSTQPMTQIGMTMPLSSQEDSDSLVLDRLFLRSPSIGSVLVTVSSDADGGSWPVSPREGNISLASTTNNLYKPGGLLLDLNEAVGQLSPDCKSCTVTLIYTEN